MVLRRLNKHCLIRDSLGINESVGLTRDRSCFLAVRRTFAALKPSAILDRCRRYIYLNGFVLVRRLVPDFNLKDPIWKILGRMGVCIRVPVCAPQSSDVHDISIYLA